MEVNIHSKSDCQLIISRIRETLKAWKPMVLPEIQAYPAKFWENDAYILGGVCPAILSNQTRYDTVDRNLGTIKILLHDYDVDYVAGLSDADLTSLDRNHFAKFKISSRIKTERKLKWIRDSAKVFQKIRKQTGAPVWEFIKNNLNQSAYDHLHQCYIQPDDATLRMHFIDGMSDFKLPGVGPAICGEFFNSIGIDEFKPDGHTINFLSRINLPSAVKTRKSHEIRNIGIEIARSLGEPRKYVDSHIWHLCAETKGEICTENDPQCNVCRLKTDEPQLCKGFPNTMDIRVNPFTATQRFKECALTPKEAYIKLDQAGIDKTTIQNVLKHVYAPAPTTL